MRCTKGHALLDLSNDLVFLPALRGQFLVELDAFHLLVQILGHGLDRGVDLLGDFPIDERDLPECSEEGDFPIRG